MILIVLFLAQQFGTGVVGSAFSPIILIWFAFNTVIGLYNIITYRPDIFKAFGPNYWFAFFLRNGRGGWEKLGGVVLCVTGAPSLCGLAQALRESCHSLGWCCACVQELLHWEACCVSQVLYRCIQGGSLQNQRDTEVWYVQINMQFAEIRAAAGTEALFADMGHFNRPSIQLSTLLLVYPALMITYLGQVCPAPLIPALLAIQ